MMWLVRDGRGRELMEFFSKNLERMLDIFSEILLGVSSLW